MNYKLYHFSSLTSTQDKAKEFAKKRLSDAVIISDIQAKGRGRFNRKWHSSKGGLWMSILLKPDKAENLQYLTFAAAVSVAKSIKKITGISAKIKWPNDVHYKGKKLCGILTEGIFGKENYVVVGIGLNANQKIFPEDIRKIASSLRIIKNKNYNIEKLSIKIINEFFSIYDKLYNKTKLENILTMWKKYSDTLGKNVEVATRTGKFHGIAVGVDHECRLLVQSENKKIITITEGDVSVRY